MTQRPVPFNESPEAAKARRRRNVAIALALVGFIVLVFLVTIIRLGANVGTRF